MPNPETPRRDRGELIRALRTYIGLSQRELSRRLSMDRRSLQRIENCQEPCPVGFIDVMRKMADEFDDAVDQIIAAAERMAGEEGGPIVIEVSDADFGAWERAVVGRAAVESGDIMPTIVGTQEERTA